MNRNRQIALLYLIHLLLYFAVAELNAALATVSITLHLEALLLLFFGLQLRHFSGIVLAAFLGLLSGAGHPGGPGLMLVAFLLLFAFLVWCQNRIRRQNPLHVRIVAVCGQVLFTVALAFALGRGEWTNPDYWIRLIIDGAFSTLVLFLVAWPWCRFNTLLLASFGWDLESQLAAH
jgi:cell shape-determining protein MreD